MTEIGTPATERTTSTSEPLVFEPPGPGCWEADLDHQSTPRGRLFEDLFLTSFESGFRSCFARYGMPLETLQARSVHGWLYTKATVAGAPDKGGPPPPDIVLKIVARVLPEMRRRNREAKRALRERRWAHDVEQWAKERSGWLESANELLGVDPSSLGDHALAEYVGAAAGRARAMLVRHFELVGVGVAVGRLLVAARDWGLDQTDVRQLLAGASPATSATSAPLLAMAELVESSGRDPHSIEELRSISPKLNEHIDRYLDEWGWRVLADDIEEPTFAESPDHLMQMIRGARHGGVSAQAAPEARMRLMDSVSQTDRGRFDRLVDDARAAYGCLDDHSGVTSLLLGVFRRAALEVGSRAASDGRVDSPQHIWNTGVDELLELAAGRRGPGAAELRRRSDDRAAAAHLVPPATLGDAPAPPPDAGLFPGPMASMVAGFGAFVGDKFTGNEPEPSGAQAELVIAGEVVLSGHAVGAATATGRVVVARDAFEALDRIEPGDIVVCNATTPAWNSLFPMLAGIVTQTGGPMSHAAVLAREFDLPAIIGAGKLDAAWHGTEGEIRPLAPAR